MGDLHKDMAGADLHSPKDHASSHETDGEDEISVSSLEFGSTELKPTGLPALMQLLWQLPGVIATLETKISLLSQEVKRINTNFDLSDRF